MSYISEIQGRVGEGLRKRKSKSQLVIQKKVVYKGKLRSREGSDSYREGVSTKKSKWEDVYKG